MKHILFLIRRMSLPKEGTTHTHKRSGNAYSGFTGVVSHHDRKDAYMLYSGSAWLVNIKPRIFGIF